MTALQEQLRPYNDHRELGEEDRVHGGEHRVLGGEEEHRVHRVQSEHRVLGGEDEMTLRSSSSLSSLKCSSRPSIRYERILSHSSC